MEAKSIFLSKTFWFNILALIVIVANAFGFADFTPSPEIDEYATVLIVLVNIALRLMTKEPVRLR